MNPIKQEIWDFGSDVQDFHWNASCGLPQSPYFNPEVVSEQVKVEIVDEIQHSSSGPPLANLKEPKKRGRPKKIKDESGTSEQDGKSGEKKGKQENQSDQQVVTKKRKDRFNGMPEEEVVQRLLPDHLAHNLDILIIGINPGLFAAYVGHHYAGPGNHFWRCMYLSGLIPEPMNAYDDYKLLSLGIGFTNMCARTTRGSSDLKKQEIREGADILRKKLVMYKPKIAVFNGKGIFEIFSGNKNFSIGKQPDKVEGTNTVLFVMPSSSARCAQLPRAADKVPYYLAIKKIRDYLKGDLPSLDESELVFPPVEPKPRPDVKEEASEEDEDSRLSCGADSSTKEMTLEQIQNQAEYLEALIASAEGKDMSVENNSGKNLQHKLESCGDADNSGSGDEATHPYTPQIEELKPRNSQQPQQGFKSINSIPAQSSPAVTVKQEVSCDYESLTVNGPAAQKVSLEDESDPYHLYVLPTPQYLSLGELPSKIAARKSKYSVFHSDTCSPPSADLPQDSLGRFSQSSLSQGKISCPNPGTKLPTQASSLQHYHSRTGIAGGQDSKVSGVFHIN